MRGKARDGSITADRLDLIELLHQAQPKSSDNFCRTRAFKYENYKFSETLTGRPVLSGR